MSIPEAVVLAGGFGTRIRGTLGDTPKALADLEGKTLLERKLDELRDNGVVKAHILTCIGHHQVSQLLDTYRESHQSLEILEHFDGKQPLGTGGAVLQVLPALSTHFFLTYGDSLLSLEYASLVEATINTGLPHAISVTSNPGPSDQLNCHVADQRLIKYNKSGGADMNSTDYGVLLFSSDQLKAEMSTQTFPFDIAPIISQLAVHGKMSAVLTDKKYLEIGTPQALLEVREYFRTAVEESKEDREAK